MPLVFLENKLVWTRKDSDVKAIPADIIHVTKDGSLRYRKATKAAFGQYVWGKTVPAITWNPVSSYCDDGKASSRPGYNFTSLPVTELPNCSAIYDEEVGYIAFQPRKEDIDAGKTLITFADGELVLVEPPKT